MITKWIDEELSYELEEETFTKEDKIKTIQDFWGCSEENAIYYYNNLKLKGGK